MMKRRRVLQRTRALLLVLVLLLFLAAAGFAVVRTHFNPIAEELAITQAKNKASDLINDAIADQITNGSIQYDRIIYFEKDLDGRITALKTNMSEVNRLKTDVLNLINDQILDMDVQSISIPLGSVFLPEFFSGQGPRIPVKVIAISNSDGQFISSFSEAGINQTLQQVIMEVSIDVTILVLKETVTFHIMSQMVVAETIIVGAVPNTFVSTSGRIGQNSDGESK